MRKLLLACALAASISSAASAQAEMSARRLLILCRDEDPSCGTLIGNFYRDAMAHRQFHAVQRTAELCTERHRTPTIGDLLVDMWNLYGSEPPGLSAHDMMLVTLQDIIYNCTGWKH